MDELVSVIIPVYKVEEYLKECVESVLNQTYKRLEIVLVDDGSPDKCGEICDEYARLDERISVIHKENGGLSDARNKGFEASKGKYVLFIDSDDYIDDTMVEQLYSACKKNNADISICYFDKVYDCDQEMSLSNMKHEITFYTGKEIIACVYQGEGEKISFTAWNKMYKRCLFTENNILYPKGRFHEDTFTTYKLLYFADKVAVINKNLYHYRIRENSITTTDLNKKRCIDSFEANCETVEFFEKKSEDVLFDMAFYNLCRSIMKMYIDIHKTGLKEEKRECIQYLKNEYRKIWKKWHKNSCMSIKRESLCILFFVSPLLFCRICGNYLVVR